jgi:hypothetical protein
MREKLAFIPVHSVGLFPLNNEISFYRDEEVEKLADFFN